MNDSKNNQDKFDEAFENSFNPKVLQRNLTHAGVFVLFFESFKDYIINQPLGLYCLASMYFKDGKMKFNENDNYKKNVRSLDKKIFDASLKWFEREGALTCGDIQTIKKIQERRNVMVHELGNVLTTGIYQEDKSLISKLLEIYKKVTSWWIFNLEVDGVCDSNGRVYDSNGEEIKQESCYSLLIPYFQYIKDILLDENESTFEYVVQLKSLWQEIHKMGNNYRNK